MKRNCPDLQEASVHEDADTSASGGKKMAGPVTASTVAQGPSSRVRSKSGTGDGKSVPSRAIHVNPGYKEEGDEEGRCDQVVNTLWELARLQMLPMDASEGGVTNPLRSAWVATNLT